MAEADSTAVRVCISGRVQGVWFRGWTAQTARSFGLAGWVRNCRDGTVEALFQGPAEAVHAMVKCCHEGPPHAHVAAVEVRPEALGAHSGFEVLSTG